MISQSNIRTLEATDERQYMINEKYEVYEKHGAPIGAVNYHSHGFYEIIYVLEGEYSSVLGDRTYHLKKGDFLLIDMNVLHRYNYIEKKHDTSKRIILWIAASMLEALGGEDMDLTDCFKKRENCAWHFPIYYEELLRGYLLKLATTDGYMSEIEGAKNVTDRGYLSLFFSYLNLLCRKKEYLFQATVNEQYLLVEQVNNYIDIHLKERIGIDDLAKEVHMSKYYFLRRFKELTGTTVHAYVNQKRLVYACEELQKGKSINEVCQECGFADYSVFLRNFKQTFGIAPKKYIKDYQFI